MWFEDQFCNKCDAEAAYRDADRMADACDIHCRTMFLNVGDEGYPAEWVEDERGPRCTAFRPEGLASPAEIERVRIRYDEAMAEMRAAQAIEARRAETAKTGSVEDESAVATPCAPNHPEQSS